jgi:hypothetical protein
MVDRRVNKHNSQTFLAQRLHGVEDGAGSRQKGLDDTVVSVLRVL